jgi:hypothetical protein
MATDADKGLHLLKVAAGDHTSQASNGDHAWMTCPACLAYQELERGDGRRFLQAFLASLETPSMKRKRKALTR